MLATLTFAAHKHRNQRRKGSDQVPYIKHPVDVATILATTGGVTDLPTLQAALLHDTIEDTATTAEELEAAFGAEVTGLVLEMTDDTSLPDDERKRTQIDHAPLLSPRAKLIKLADKIANVTDIGASPPPDWTVERRARYFDWTEQVIRGCAGSHEALERQYREALATARALLPGNPPRE